MHERSELLGRASLECVLIAVIKKKRRRRQGSESTDPYITAWCVNLPPGGRARVGAILESHSLHVLLLLVQKNQVGRGCIGQWYRWLTLKVVWRLCHQFIWTMCPGEAMQDSWASITLVLHFFTHYWKVGLTKITNITITSSQFAYSDSWPTPSHKKSSSLCPTSRNTVALKCISKFLWCIGNI